METDGVQNGVSLQSVEWETSPLSFHQSKILSRLVGSLYFQQASMVLNESGNGWAGLTSCVPWRSSGLFFGDLAYMALI